MSRASNSILCQSLRHPCRGPSLQLPQVQPQRLQLVEVLVQVVQEQAELQVEQVGHWLQAGSSLHLVEVLVQVLEKKAEVGHCFGHWLQVWSSLHVQPHYLHLVEVLVQVLQEQAEFGHCFGPALHLSWEALRLERPLSPPTRAPAHLLERDIDTHMAAGLAHSVCTQ